MVQFSRNAGGMAGLAVLVIFVLLAIFAPVLFPPSQLDVTQATGMPYLPPSSEFWLGTDDSGRSVLALVVWGARVSLIVGLAATVLSMVIGTIAECSAACSTALPTGFS